MPNNYKNRVAELRESIFIEQRSLPALKKVRRFSDGVDAMLAEVYGQYIDHGEIDRHICLAALGGYGRGELCPYSDIDIMFLHSDGAGKEAIASSVRFFWDMGLNLGCVVRSRTECSRILGEDFATDTALLQARFVAGNKRMFQELETAILRPYFEKNKSRFLREIRHGLYDGISSRDNTLFRTEPDVKNGICALRDCQRILWAERVLSDGRTTWDLYHLSHFGHADVAAFSAAYEFLTAVRSELHVVCARRLDVLESALQSVVAKNLGFGPDGAGALMEAYFKAVRAVKYFALSFLEKRFTSRSLLGSIRTNMSAVPVKKGVFLLDGLLFLSKKDVPDADINALWLVDLFRLAQTYQAALSVGLENRIREAMKHLNAEDFRTPAVDEVFLDILSRDNGAGRVLDLMHETGVLAGVMPAFSSLTCKVEYDSQHEFTVDQHILLAMRALDELDKEADPAIRAVYIDLANKLPLRIALLLHDVGKAVSGDHVVTGSIIAAETCDRLGISAEDKRTVVFLVYNHLELSRLAFGRELEEHVIQEFADRFTDVESLDMLYLLTILDVRHVGTKSWTGWRAYLLNHTYEQVRTALLARKPGEERPHPPSFPCTNSLLPLHDILPEDAEKATSLLNDLHEGEFVTMLDSFAGFDRLTVLSSDRLGFFADVTGCISSEGYNIMSAKASSPAVGKILDIFHLEYDGATMTSSLERVENIKKKWRLIESGAASAEQLVEERIRRYPPRKTRGTPIATKVRFDNDMSKEWSVIELEARDRFGLLYRIARCLSSHHVNIVFARLATRIDLAVDTFYVTGPQGGKITDEAMISGITDDLLITIGDE
jgi:[protein-PII] uridylyltransferase